LRAHHYNRFSHESDRNGLSGRTLPFSTNRSQQETQAGTARTVYRTRAPKRTQAMQIRGASPISALTCL
jgi:hypothetical protein